MHDPHDDLLVVIEQHAAEVGPFGGAELVTLLVFTALIPAIMLIAAYVVM